MNTSLKTVLPSIKIPSKFQLSPLQATSGDRKGEIIDSCFVKSIGGCHNLKRDNPRNAMTVFPAQTVLPVCSPLRRMLQVLRPNCYKYFNEKEVHGLKEHITEEMSRQLMIPTWFSCSCPSKRIALEMVENL
jgi:hypothetical protein